MSFGAMSTPLLDAPVPNPIYMRALQEQISSSLPPPRNVALLNCTETIRTNLVCIHLSETLTLTFSFALSLSLSLFFFSISPHPLSFLFSLSGHGRKADVVVDVGSANLITHVLLDQEKSLETPGVES